jgi:ABC-type multidrug transport system permease subunit
LSIFGLIVVAGSFGIFLMSVVKTSQQAGPVMGGVVTMTGMLGGLMTTGFETLPAAFQTAQLFTPQGWALHAWETALDGGTAVETLWPALGCLVFGAVMFLIGVRLFRRRFA